MQPFFVLLPRARSPLSWATVVGFVATTTSSMPLPTLATRILAHLWGLASTTPLGDLLPARILLRGQHLTQSCLMCLLLLTHRLTMSSASLSLLAVQLPHTGCLLGAQSELLCHFACFTLSHLFSSRHRTALSPTAVLGHGLSSHHQQDGQEPNHSTILHTTKQNGLRFLSTPQR